MDVSNVVDFGRAKVEREPHTTGPCQCLGCGHQWIGVIPVGIDVVDCPECRTPKGVRGSLVINHAEEHWTCKCGSQMFHLISSGAYCPNCGRAWGWDEF